MEIHISHRYRYRYKYRHRLSPLENSGSKEVKYYALHFIHHDIPKISLSTWHIVDIKYKFGE